MTAVYPLNPGSVTEYDLEPQPGASSGQLARQLQAWSKLDETIAMAADFAATGDGSTDDTSAAQDAIDRCASDGGGDVFLPRGTTVVSGLVMRTGVRLLGRDRYASKLKLKASSTTDVIQTLDADTLFDSGSQAGETRFTIADFSIDGNAANCPSGGSGLKLYGYDYDVRNLTIRNPNLDGITSQWGRGGTTTSGSTGAGDSMDSRFSDITVEWPRRHGFWIRGPHDSHFTRCHSVWAGNNSFDGNGFKAQSDANSSAGGCTFTDCHVWGWRQEYAWWLDASNLFLTATYGEGANVQYYLGPNCYAPRLIGVLALQPPDIPGDVTKVGIEIDGASNYMIEATIDNCDDGALVFTDDGGEGVVRIVLINMSGGTVISGSATGSTLLSYENLSNLTRYENGRRWSNNLGVNASSFVYSAQVVGDAGVHWVCRANGDQEWGDGGGTFDAAIKRGGANRLDINNTTGGKVVLGGSGGNVGFYGSTGSTKPTVTGSRGGNAALADLLTKLAAQGLIVDGSS